MNSRNARGLQKVSVIDLTFNISTIFIKIFDNLSLFQSRELGLAKLMSSFWACSVKSVKDQLGIES